MTATFCGNAGGTESGLHRPAQALPASRETQDFKTEDARLEVRGEVGVHWTIARIGPEYSKFSHDVDGRVGVPSRMRDQCHQGKVERSSISLL